jgi:hypothetical protein
MRLLWPQRPPRLVAVVVGLGLALQGCTATYSSDGEEVRLFEPTHRELASTPITIPPSNANLVYIGRWKAGADATTRVFDWGGCTVRMRITGTSSLGLAVQVRVRPWEWWWWVCDCLHAGAPPQPSPTVALNNTPPPRVPASSVRAPTPSPSPPYPSQETSTNRYQVSVNGVIQTIVQTTNTSNRFPLVSNLVKTTTYDVVRGPPGAPWPLLRTRSPLPTHPLTTDQVNHRPLSGLRVRAQSRSGVFWQACLGPSALPLLPSVPGFAHCVPCTPLFPPP